MQGSAVGPLHGVPLSIKSAIDVRGFRCESGTKLRQGHIAEKDAPLVARLRQAGAIILGVTNAPELLMAWETDNLLYGRTNSPWDLARTPGGSSGGEAAAIASGCSAGGVGSDGGGSIRVPAHFSGVCGLKPTPGRIPATGHFPQSAGPFALIGVVGPMARTIADLKVLFEVMQGPDDGDPSAAPVPVRWPSKDDLRKLRIGYFFDDDRTPVTSETCAAVNVAAESLRRAGFQVDQFRPDGLEEARQLWWKFFGIAGGMMLGPMTKGYEAEISPLLQQFSDWVAHRTRSLRRIVARRLDSARLGAYESVRANARVSHSVVSGGGDSRISSWRAQLAGRGQDRELSRRMELYRMVQSARFAGCGSARWQIAGRLAHWGANRRTSLGRGIRVVGCGSARIARWGMAQTSARLISERAFD